jgi:hypothetical protein
MGVKAKSSSTSTSQTKVSDSVDKKTSSTGASSGDVAIRKNSNNKKNRKTPKATAKKTAIAEQDEQESLSGDGLSLVSSSAEIQKLGDAGRGHAKMNSIDKREDHGRSDGCSEDDGKPLEDRPTNMTIDSSPGLASTNRKKENRQKKKMNDNLSEQPPPSAARLFPITKMIVNHQAQEYAQNLVELKQAPRPTPMTVQPQSATEAADEKDRSQNEVDKEEWWALLVTPRCHVICLVMNLFLLFSILSTSRLAAHVQHLSSMMAVDDASNSMDATGVKRTLSVENAPIAMDVMESISGEERVEVVTAVPPVAPPPPPMPKEFKKQQQENRGRIAEHVVMDEDREMEMDKILFHKKIKPRPERCKEDGATFGYSSWSSLRDAIHSYNGLYNNFREHAMIVSTSYSSWAGQELKRRPAQKPPPPSLNHLYAKDESGRLLRYAYDYSPEDEVDSYIVDPDTGDILYNGRGLQSNSGEEGDLGMRLEREVYAVVQSRAGDNGTPKWEMLPAHHPLSHPPPEPFVICPGEILDPSSSSSSSRRTGRRSQLLSSSKNERENMIFINAPYIQIQCDACTVNGKVGTHFSFGPKAKDVSIVGLTLMGATSSSVLFHHDGADVSFEDCTWMDNVGGVASFTTITNKGSSTSTAAGAGAVADLNSTSTVNFYRCEISDSKQRPRATPNGVGGSGLHNSVGSSLTIRN